MRARGRKTQEIKKRKRTRGVEERRNGDLKFDKQPDEDVYKKKYTIYVYKLYNEFSEKSLMYKRRQFLKVRVNP